MSMYVSGNIADCHELSNSQ